MSGSAEIGQHSRWLLREIEPGTATHCIAAVARFPGTPDIPAVKHALRALATRHTALRMTFPPGGGAAKRSARIAEACLREGEAPDLDDAQFTKWIDYAAQEPFDLARGPRLRVHVYGRGTDETIVLVLAHRFIADVWSMTTLVRELEALYLEQAGHEPAPIPEPVAADKELDRLYRWVGGRRASVHAAQDHGSGGRITGHRQSSGVTLTSAAPAGSPARCACGRLHESVPPPPVPAVSLPAPRASWRG